MGTGPILILDKSAFQMLSSREHLRRTIHFFDNLTPVLVMEVLGDLTKVLKDGKDPSAKVAELAGKFHGSGGPVNHQAGLLVRQSLIGTDVPMTGQVLAQGGRQVNDESLGPGFFIDLTWWNEAIMRWRRGNFSDVEKHYSELWRVTTHLPGFSALWDNITRHHIVLPTIKSPDELGAALDNVTNEPSLQDAWLEILLERFGASRSEGAYILERWNRTNKPLRTFAPYAAHCLRVWVGLVMIVHHKLFKWNPTHLVDLQYLNYLPFCQVFSSEDRLHQLLVPALMRRDQTFIRGSDLKATLKLEADRWEALDEPRHSRLQWALASPLPVRESLLFQTWVRHCNPKPGTNRVCHLSDPERQIAVQEAEEMLPHAWDGYIPPK